MQSIFPSTSLVWQLVAAQRTDSRGSERYLTVWQMVSLRNTYRDKVLKTEDSASVALKYNDIIAMKRAENSVWQGMDVIYIYHDNIP